MKPVMRYQSQLLFRKSYKPIRIVRIRPDAKGNRLFLPARTGLDKIRFFRPVAQEQSNRSITGRPRSVTALDDQFPGAPASSRLSTFKCQTR
jgi:hypothetical protein